MTLVQVLVISKIGYCNALYVGFPLKLTWSLQQVPNATARLIYFPSAGLAAYVSCTFPSQFKCVGTNILYTALMVCGLLLSEHLPEEHHPMLINPSRPVSYGWPLWGMQMFLWGAQHFWNSLPVEICKIPSLPAFKKPLKTSLFDPLHYKHSFIYCPSVCVFFLAFVVFVFVLIWGSREGCPNWVVQLGGLLMLLSTSQSRDLH